MNCSNCGAELRSGSLFCQDCGMSVREISEWPDKPWLYIWNKPRMTIRAIIDSEPEKYVLILAILAGITRILAQAFGYYMGSSYMRDIVPLLVIIVASLLFGAASGLISLLISGAVLKWSGNLLGGQASAQEVRTAVAWSSVPSIVWLLLWVPLLAVFGNEMSAIYPEVNANPSVLLCGSLLGTVSGLWSGVLLIVTLSEVHRFSNWRSIGTLAIPFIVIFVPLAGCLFLTR